MKNESNNNGFVGCLHGIVNHKRKHIPLFDNEIKETGNHYTTTFRQYDPRIGRWFNVDPMADKHPDYTPYAYVYNNPIMLKDPYGLDSVFYDTKGSEINRIPCDKKFYFLKHEEGNLNYKGDSYFQGISRESFFGDRGDKSRKREIFNKVDKLTVSTFWKISNIVDGLYTK